MFWLRLIGRISLKQSKEVEDLIREGGEIVAIVSTIIRNAFRNNKGSK